MYGSSFKTTLATAATAVFVLSACSEQRLPTEPSRSSAPVLALSNGQHIATIVAHDACDIVTFNQLPLQPGTCVKHGHVTFPEFIAELQATQVAAAWKFSSENVTARLGLDVFANNVGGEVHTFTAVRQFGGGLNDILNQLSGNPTVAPECRALDADDMVASGATYRIEADALAAAVDANGIARVQCCIHPWMRSEIHTARGA
jgi:hypothetical protein